MKRIAIIVWVGLAAALAGVGAEESAEPESNQPEQGVFVSGEVLGLYNVTDGPRAALGARIWYQQAIIERSGPLFDPARIEFGLQNRWAPVFNDVSAFVYFEPIAAFDLTASVGYQYQYEDLIGGGYYRMNSYDEDPTDDIDGRSTNQGGTVVRIAPRFKFAMWGIVVTHTVQFSFVDYSAGDNDDFNYFADTGGGIDEVLNEQDFWIQNSSLLLYQVTPSLLAGLSSVADTVPDADRTNYQLSLAAIYDRPLGETWSLGLVGFAGTYLQHRWLEGEPNVTVLVSFSRRVL